MGYRHIDNLYKHPNFLQCYALEKIHGTSANITFTNKVGIAKEGSLKFFSGGASHELFVSLFDHDTLLNKFIELFPANEDGIHPEVTVYGESFGGKLQGMSHIYGSKLRFMAFEVKINDRWSNVPYAEHIVKKLGLEFVPYEKGPLTIEWLDEQRDRPSLVAIVPDAIREGIVIRQVNETPLINGGRHIYKHKRQEFMEHKTPRKVKELSPEESVILSEAKEIAEEWVVTNRLNNALSHFAPEDVSFKNFSNILKYLVDDVLRESQGEIVVTPEAIKAIQQKSADLIRGHLTRMRDE